MECKEQIKQAIIEVFAHEPYPGDEFIALYPESYLGEQILRDFKGRHWRDIPHDVASWCSAGFFQPEGRRFYWPAFLIAALDMLPDGRINSCLYGLIPPADPARFVREYGTYTLAERHAVRLFLECVRDETSSRYLKEVATLALDRYWGRESEDPHEGASRAPANLTRKEQIRQSIIEAFADVPHPGDEAIAEHPEGQDGPELIRDFKGYHWREVPHDLISYDYDCISYFSREGLRFYLPSYVLAALEGDPDTLSWVVYTLDPMKDDPDLVKWSKARYSVFRPAERQTIRLFLEYVRDELGDSDLKEHARQALDQYWAKEP